MKAVFGTWSAAAIVLLFQLFLGLAGPTAVRAQQQGGTAARSARDAAPIDLTGYWVSYVTENWRYRMVTPARGSTAAFRPRLRRCLSLTPGIRPPTSAQATSANPMVRAPS